MHLTTNMRVQLQNDPTATIFSRQLRELGNVTVPTNPGTENITFPYNFCIFVNSVEELVDKVFQSIKQIIKITQKFFFLIEQISHFSG